MSAEALRLDDAPYVRVVSLAELEHAADGPTRGYAHVGAGLDFAPLSLFASGLLHPGEGLAMHRHEGIENVMVMLAGRMAHEDSLGNACELGCDEIAVLSAGAGVEHAERVVGDEDVRALVVWIRSPQPNAAPTFMRRRVPRSGEWTVLVERGSLHAEAELRRIVLARGATCRHDLSAGKRAYAIVLGGALELGDAVVGDGERILAEGAGALRMRARDRVEIVLLELG